MPSLSLREKRTIRIATILIVVYLALFFGIRGVKHLEAKRAGYHELANSAVMVRAQLLRYENRVLMVEKLREKFRINLSAVSKAALVGEASAAIQKAAQTGGIQIGPIRESGGSASGRELAVMQVECMGQIPAMMQLLHRLEHLGYPVLVDSVQITPENRPGMIKVILHLVILDFEQWKGEEKRNA